MQTAAASGKGCRFDGTRLPFVVPTGVTPALAICIREELTSRYFRHIYTFRRLLSLLGMAIAKSLSKIESVNAPQLANDATGSQTECFRWAFQSTRLSTCRQTPCRRAHGVPGF